MNDFLNVSNPDKKIKNILKEAIKTRQTDIETLNSEIDSIKKQETDGNIFVPLSKTPEFTPQYVASAVATLIGDILNGFYEGVQKIKEDTDNVASNVEQRGGKSEDDKDKKGDKDEKKQLSAKAKKTEPSATADNIKDQADK